MHLSKCKRHFLHPGKAKMPKHTNKDKGTRNTHSYLTWHVENKPHFKNNRTAAQQKRSTKRPFQPLFLEVS